MMSKIICIAGLIMTLGLPGIVKGERKAQTEYPKGSLSNLDLGHNPKEARQSHKKQKINELPAPLERIKTLKEPLIKLENRPEKKTVARRKRIDYQLTELTEPPDRNRFIPIVNASPPFIEVAPWSKINSESEGFSVVSFIPNGLDVSDQKSLEERVKTDEIYSEAYKNKKNRQESGLQRPKREKGDIGEKIDPPGSSNDLANVDEDHLESSDTAEQEESTSFFLNFENLSKWPENLDDEYGENSDIDPVLISLEGQKDFDFFLVFFTDLFNAGSEIPENGELIIIEPSVAKTNVQSPPVEKTSRGTEAVLAVKHQKTKVKSTVPDIPIYSNKRIKAFIRLYTVKKRKIFIQAIERSGKYMKMIHRIFREHGLPLNLAYLAVVESNFNPNARSRANAVGMWQFMGYTGKVFGLSQSWWHDERYDPEKSTIAAAKYLKQLHNQFNGKWELVLAAYNSGSGRVRRAIRKAEKRGKSTDYWSLRLPRETRGYVPAFFAVATIFKDLKAYGFDRKPVLEEETPKKNLTVAGGLSLNQISRELNIDRKILHGLNPSLRLRGLTPATFDKYEIAIPAQVSITEDQHQALRNLAKDRHENWKFHRVRQGETLWSISRYYRIPVKKNSRV